MRLLKVSSLELGSDKLELCSFIGKNIPQYAILSHTWTHDEVLFDDIKNGTSGDRGAFNKLELAVKQATRDRYEWIWIDTCCIDKSSSTELQEAINSMFNWYKGSTVCYAFLADVQDPPVDVVPEDDDAWKPFERSFLRSRWFKRGWTLQELLAPGQIRFFSYGWISFGRVDLKDAGGPSLSPVLPSDHRMRVYRADLIEYPLEDRFQNLLERATGIELPYLRGRQLSEASIATRMSWAASRETTREEDTAYCLMGIFDVNMPLLYGEGPKAFLRLQEEIMRYSDDNSLFTWRADGALCYHNHGVSRYDTNDSEKLSIFLRRQVSTQDWLEERKASDREFEHHYLAPRHRERMAYLPEDDDEVIRGQNELALSGVFHGLLAENPSFFKHSSKICRTPRRRDYPPHAMTNQGIQIMLPLHSLAEGMFIAVLDCCPLKADSHGRPTRYGIYVSRMPTRNNQFARVLCDRMAAVDLDDGRILYRTETIFVGRSIGYNERDAILPGIFALEIDRSVEQRLELVQAFGFKQTLEEIPQSGGNWDNINCKYFNPPLRGMALLLVVKDCTSGERYLLSFGVIDTRTVGYDLIPLRGLGADFIERAKHPEPLLALSPVFERKPLNEDLYVWAKTKKFSTASIASDAGTPKRRNTYSLQIGLSAWTDGRFGKHEAPPDHIPSTPTKPVTRRSRISRLWRTR